MRHRRQSRPSCRELKATAEVALLPAEADHKVYNIIQLIYRSKNYEGESKDFEFSRRSMEEHWKAGYNDAGPHPASSGGAGTPKSLDGVFTFDLAVHGRIGRMPPWRDGMTEARSASARSRCRSQPGLSRGPYRFVDREYLIITYRTDPRSSRELVPEPLEFGTRW